MSVAVVKNELRISPDQHGNAVVEFLNSYRLQRKDPNRIYLHQILEHFARIPYENLSKIISLHKSPSWSSPYIRLPEELIADHLTYGLGGTCFSLTFYLQTILTNLKFSCYPVMADMRAGKNIHCCLIVILDGSKYLVDPGYLLTEPMPIDPERPVHYRAEHAGVELGSLPENRGYDLFTFNKHGKKWRYRFEDRPVSSETFLQCWLASFRRNSMHGICLTRVQKDGILFVNRTFMRETTFTQKKNHNIRKNYHQAIHERFGIATELIEQAQEALKDNLARERKLGLWVPR